MGSDGYSFFVLFALYGEIADRGKSIGIGTTIRIHFCSLYDYLAPVLQVPQLSEEPTKNQEYYTIPGVKPHRNQEMRPQRYLRPRTAGLLDGDCGVQLTLRTGGEDDNAGIG